MIKIKPIISSETPQMNPKAQQWRGDDEDQELLCMLK